MRIHTGGKLSGVIEATVVGRLRRPTNPTVARRGAGRAAEPSTAQHEQRRHGDDGMDERENREEQQGGQKRVTLGPVGEPFTSGTG
jgi:hypothetical protein